MSDRELLLAISEMIDVKIKSSLQIELQSVKEGLRDLEHKLTGIEMHLENTTDKNIQLLAENYVPAAKRYEREALQIEAMKQDIEILKKDVMEHSEKLQKLA